MNTKQVLVTAFAITSGLSIMVIADLVSAEECVGEQCVNLNNVVSGSTSVTHPQPTNTSSSVLVPVESNNSSEQNAELNQQQEGSLVNQQVNVNNIGSYSFGNGIECATPGIALNAFGNSFGGDSGLGATVSYVVPLGGKVGRNCRELTTEILKQRQLDTNFALVRQCTEFAKAGVIIDYKRFPQLELCQGISIRQNVSVKQVVNVTPPKVEVLPPPTILIPPVQITPPAKAEQPPKKLPPVRALW